MNERIQAYILEFFVFTFFAAVFGILGFAFTSTIYLLVFVLASLNLVFTKEKINRNEFYIPEAHNYQAQRTNIYGYLMALSLTVVTLSYYVLVFLMGLPAGVIISLLWVLMIFLSILASRKAAEEELPLSISDFILMNTRNPQISLLQLRRIIKQLLNESDQSTNHIKQKFEILLLENNIPTNHLNRWVLQYFDYLHSVENEIAPKELA